MLALDAALQRRSDRGAAAGGPGGSLRPPPCASPAASNRGAGHPRAGDPLLPGGPLARLEAQIAIGTLRRRMPALRLAVPAESLRWAQGLNLRGLQRLPLAS